MTVFQPIRHDGPLTEDILRKALEREFKAGRSPIKITLSLQGMQELFASPMERHYEIVQAGEPTSVPAGMDAEFCYDGRFATIGQSKDLPPGEFILELQA